VKSAFRTAGLTLALSALWLAPRPALGAAPDPQAQAEALIRRLDVAETRSRIAEPLTKAKDAQRRAQNARGAGDLKHASELDTLALLWAQVADDLLTTALAEQKLNDVQKKASDLERRALDTQALVEQAIARRGRAQQNLAETESKSKSVAPAKPAEKPHSKGKAPRE
jgi:hypothetical protein